MRPSLVDLERLVTECDMDSFMASYRQQQQKNQAIKNISSYNSSLLASGGVEPSAVKRWLDEQKICISIDSQEVKNFKANEEHLMKQSIHPGHLGV